MGFFNDIDWNKVAQKGAEIAGKAGEAVEKKQQELIKKFQTELRRKSDQQIRNGLRNIDSSDWKYSYIQDESRRRGL